MLSRALSRIIAARGCPQKNNRSPPDPFGISHTDTAGWTRQYSQPHTYDPALERGLVCPSALSYEFILGLQLVECRVHLGQFPHELTDLRILGCNVLLLSRNLHCLCRYYPSLLLHFVE